MSEPERQITIRRLPDGEIQGGFERALKGALLEAELTSGAAGDMLDAGALVEVQSQARIYLGEVRTVRGATLSIWVEHIVDRAALTAIQRTWQPPR